MNISTTSGDRSRAKKKGKLTPQDRFSREWKRVQTLQAQNARLEQDVRALAAEVIAKIAPAELQLAQANYHLAEKLLGFAERKSLSQWQREELLHWIQQILVRLSAQPFADSLDIEALFVRLGEHVDTLLGDEDGPEDEGSEDDEQLQQEQDLEDALDELLEEFIEQESVDAEADDSFASEKAADPAQSLSRLLKSSSINQMFRRIASAIHPDRELDEQRRLQRNTLMAQLVRAREEKDIPTIFNLYQEYVGESPLAFIGDDLDKVVTLLKHQAQQLRSQKDDIIHANPLHGAIYQRFNNKSQRKMQQAVDDHVQKVSKEALAHARATRCITNLGRLKALLEERAAVAEFDRYS